MFQMSVWRQFNWGGEKESFFGERTRSGRHRSEKTLGDKAGASLEPVGAEEGG